LVCVNERDKEDNKSAEEPGRCFCKFCFWDNKTSKKCEPMDKNNKVCTAANGPNSTDCTDCHNDATKTDAGTCKAKDGFYMDNKKECGKVTKCDPTCKTCDGTGPNSCLTCEEDRTY